MGVDGLSSITYYGSGANYNLGQNNNANYPWPRVNVNDYRRTIDFTKPASLVDGRDVRGARHGRPRGAGAVHAEHHDREPGVGAAARDLGHAVGLPEGRAAEQRDGARGAPSTASSVTVLSLGLAGQVAGRRSRTASSATSTATTSSTRVETWLENPVFGDMLVETNYTDYRDNMRPEVSGRDRAEARRLADVRRADPGRAREPGEPHGADDAARSAGRRRRSAARRPARCAAGCRVGEARERRLPHHGRLRRARRRVQRSHRDLRAGRARTRRARRRSSPKRSA